MGCHHYEVLTVIIVVMLVMGVNRLPQIGDSLGRAIRNFKRGVQGENEIDVTPPKKRVESGARSAPAADRTRDETDDADRRD
ncbi:MAG: twin-arginine translocase TatA/TatE family subunit [Deltaproteobacteria bacterium]|nr:twin-arginine translocase TatA/TatE family subunit [Deltaproteobacteria bacterium]